MKKARKKLSRKYHERRTREVKAAWRKYDSTLESGFNILEHLGFSTVQRGRVLGYHINWPSDIRAIAEHAKAFRNEDIETRLNLLIRIMARVDALFQHENGDVQKWFTSRNQALANRTPRATMSSGDMRDLVLIDSHLARMTG